MLVHQVGTVKLLLVTSFQAFDGEGKGFNLVDRSSGGALAGSIAEAYEKGEGWLGYYWAPTAILGKYPMKS
ncbi:MAG: hypothetical protein CM15mP70_11160 [Pelagibacteraceae bacterium]|nr:MAG: hypothetical protein CM15mP70_11160 [Pelagibacteraceae bacterium]